MGAPRGWFSGLSALGAGVYGNHLFFSFKLLAAVWVIGWCEGKCEDDIEVVIAKAGILHSRNDMLHSRNER